MTQIGKTSMSKVNFNSLLLFRTLDICLNLAQCQEETRPVLDMLHIKMLYFTSITAFIAVQLTRVGRETNRYRKMAAGMAPVGSLCDHSQTIPNHKYIPLTPYWLYPCTPHPPRTWEVPFYHLTPAWSLNPHGPTGSFLKPPEGTWRSLQPVGGSLGHCPTKNLNNPSPLPLSSLTEQQRKSGWNSCWKLPHETNNLG